MINWIIKLLGGYTQRDIDMVVTRHNTLKVTNCELLAKLKKAQKNDMPRDPKTGRFIEK